MPAVSGTVMLTDCLMSEQSFLPQELGAAQTHVWLGALQPERPSELCDLPRVLQQDGPLERWLGCLVGGSLQLSIKEVA